MSRKPANAGDAAVLAAMPSAMTTPAQLERLGEHLRKLRQQMGWGELEEGYYAGLRRTTAPNLEAHAEPAL